MDSIYNIAFISLIVTIVLALLSYGGSLFVKILVDFYKNIKKRINLKSFSK